MAGRDRRRWLPLPRPSAVLRDKQVLVVPANSGPGGSAPSRTPAELQFAAVNRYEGVFELAKDGTTKGNVRVTMRGDDEVLMLCDKWREPSGNSWASPQRSFNGKANSVTLNTRDDLSMPWGMRYGCTQDAWSQWKSYQIGSLLPNVNLSFLIDEKNQQKQEIGRRQSGGRRGVHAPTATQLLRSPKPRPISKIRARGPFLPGCVRKSFVPEVRAGTAA